MRVKKIYDGGPAFPCPATGRLSGDTSVSVRDFFAAKAMQGMLSNPALKRANWGEGEFIDSVVGDAWMAADAMLAERAKSK